MFALLKAVLIIDDSQFDRFIHSYIVKQVETVKDIFCAETAMQALKILKEDLIPNNIIPDLILLDINMPVMSGWDFLEQYNQLVFEGKENVKIVILSSSTSDSDYAKAQNMCTDGYIEKPLTSEKFAELTINLSS